MHGREIHAELLVTLFVFELEERVFSIRIVVFSLFSKK